MSKIVIANFLKQTIVQGAVLVPDDVASDEARLKAYLEEQAGVMMPVTDEGVAETQFDSERTIEVRKSPVAALINTFYGECVAVYDHNGGHSIPAMMEADWYNTERYVLDSEIVGFGVYRAGFVPTPIDRHRAITDEVKKTSLPCIRGRVKNGSEYSFVAYTKRGQVKLLEWSPKFDVVFIPYRIDGKVVGFEFFKIDAAVIGGRSVEERYVYA